MKRLFLFLDKYKWLIIGGILMPFYNGRYVIPIATWLGPLFIVRYYRTAKSKKDIGLCYIVMMLSSFISFKGVTGLEGSIEYVVLIGMSFIFFSPFFIDKLIASKFKGFKSTLVLPLAGVTVEYLFSIISPYCTWGSIAYSQYGNLELEQLLSITGIWGISFILYWFYSAINWMWENNFHIAGIKKGVSILMSVIFLVLLAGGIRVKVFNTNSDTVKIASISVPHKPLWKDIDLIMDGSGNTAENISEVKDKLTGLHEELLNLTVREARNGAKVIFWHECNGLVFKEDEDMFIKQTSEIAKKYNIYIMMSIGAFKPGINSCENKVVMIDSNGEIGFQYEKTKIVPGDNDIKSDGIIKYVDTPYGRIGSAICYDMDFPSHIRQAGKKNIDILLVPSSDWKEIDPIHTEMASFRAVENGFNFVRQVQNGYSLSTDYLGDTISSMDFFNTEDKVMLSHVPTKGTRTIYSLIGDFFAWICVGVFCILMACIILKKRNNMINKSPGQHK